MNANVETLFRGSDEVYDSIVELVPGPDKPTPIVRAGERFNPHAGFEASKAVSEPEIVR